MKFGYSNSLASVSTISQALSFIDASDRDTWIKCGMAVKSELGDAGFDAWDRWSSTADNYNSRDAAASWQSFNDGGVGIGTLFHFAKQNGYANNINGKPTPPSPEQIAQREVKHKAADELISKHRTDAALKAQAIWNAPPSELDTGCPLVRDHAYLKNKGIMPHGAKIFRGSLIIREMDCSGALMIPTMLGGKITSLQFINPHGEKRFLYGGEKGGYLIGKIKFGKPVCICEGFATGATIHQATGYAVVVAFDAGNLRKMAEALRANNPDVKIVLCADDDKTGTGQRKATEAAQAVGGFVAMPVFSEGASHE